MSDSLDETLAAYRDHTRFDSTAKVTHSSDCAPGNCSLTGYLKDGRLVYEEQTGRYPEVDSRTPDWNPRGCGSQCSYTQATYGEERIRQPMKQMGERGSDDWEPISWEAAYEEIADALIDAVEEHPQSVLSDGGPLHGGPIQGQTPIKNLVTALGGLHLDSNAMTGDFRPGIYTTFGKYLYSFSDDELPKADLILVWHGNPSYSRQPSYHFLTEARYLGTEIVTIAPDYNPTSVHADRYISVNPASDAALCMGIARVLIERDLVDRSFVKEQTDLPLLVRLDNDRFLRASDLEDDGYSDQFYVWDDTEGLVEAPRETLALDGVNPHLEGTYEVTIHGEQVQVAPAFELLRSEVDEGYDLETVRAITGVPPETVEELAEKVAANRTIVLTNYNIAKIFHGHQLGRGMALVCGLTGNWGRKGTGPVGWNILRALSHPFPRDPKLEQAIQDRATRPLTDEEMAIELTRLFTRLNVTTVTQAWFWYRHCNYDEVWAGVDDLPRDIASYVEEAGNAEGWEYLALPAEDVEPRVFITCACNTLRNKRGGSRHYLQDLWPKLEKIVCIDYRWSGTAMYSDIVLPASFQHEKAQFHQNSGSEVRFWAYAEGAVEPVYGSKPELAMAEELATVIQERAKQRGLESYEVPQGLTPEKLHKLTDIDFDRLPSRMDRSMGVRRSYHDLVDRLTHGGALTNARVEDHLESVIGKAVDDGILEAGTDLNHVKETGFVKYEGLGDSFLGSINATKVEPDDTTTIFTKHTEDKQRFPTLTGRAQFYIDHEWWLEAGQQLPVHLDPPASHGGDRETYPFFVTSGHNRHSKHANTLVNETQLNRHRGEPHLFINRKAAEMKGVTDGEYVRVFNDYGDFTVQAKVSSLPREDQVIIYHAWDVYQYPGGKPLHHLTPGIINPLLLATDYGHFKYAQYNWHPALIDRHVSVDFEPVDPRI